ncbi:tRNA-dihydrouridine(47) synthase [NAD(P)(+)]-like [Sabethes cyaneus]|uniref:tRNA-dihydrouridine(47) synthase [NAD(P)(+)]-like n=1 Tax=Sabethes cyaneus TaxID=53552 RepID=UPI00237D6969|nr:tRNA-dihydrouridine(47) synthase [NAD(P)(+)]-like [Sabethes cyaneus]XP_053695128.1 tRNA-dihydrouridine(47) synthase [NAD(P)(+)]-like [Sabethes cyaneus]
MDETVCYIKAQYLVAKPAKESIEKEGVNVSHDNSEQSNQDGPPSKKPRFEKGKKKRGQNKNRQLPFKEHDDVRLCKSLLNGTNSTETEGKCANPSCRFSHDLKKFIQLKPKDISDSCYIYSVKGYCNFGVTCRFAGAHLDENLNNKIADGVERSDTNLVSRCLGFELQSILRKKSYNFEKSTSIVEKLEASQKAAKEKLKNGDESTTQRSGFCSDEDLIKVRKEERKRIDFTDKLYLSPLTTVGNLPFRRICKEYGVDITCGEMACAVPIINGLQQEWALTKRHQSEDLFGVQLCGRSPKLVTYAAQVITETADVDFIDINLGCPIDLIFKEGGGSALLRRQPVLEVMVQSCSQMLSDYGKELTVKTRVGIYNNKNVAHELIPKFEEWGASLVTVHGRSKEQRYTKQADWDYVQKCAQQAKTMPVFGNGDILSYEDYNNARLRAADVKGVMIGRGALIKPWVFQEIKEQKILDLSSSERLEMLKRYVNYGLEHWGSDTKGVENTRRFLLEWQSFLYRYVPYGLLERPPQKINQRPQAFQGRDDLETLMASPNCADWVKLSEMLLGPVPEGFNFVPKHKANAY